MSTPKADGAHRLLTASNQLGQAASGVGFWAGIMHEHPELVPGGTLREMAAVLRAQADVIEKVAGAHE